MASSLLPMPASGAAAKLDEAEGASTVHGSAAEGASSPSSSSSSSPRPDSAAAGGGAGPAGCCGEEPQAPWTPFDRFMMLYDPHWAHVHQQCLEEGREEREEEEEEEEEEARGEDQERELEERLRAEAFPALEPEAATSVQECEAFPALEPEAATLVQECQALQLQARGVARDLSAIAGAWDGVSEERSDFELERSKAAVERMRLQERAARLRGILQRLRGKKASEEAEAAPARRPAGRLGSAETSLKLCKRAQLSRHLLAMLRRAERFDRDEDGLGQAPPEALAEEAAALAAFRDEAAAELRAMEAEAGELYRLRNEAREENRQLQCRIQHLRTCVASAKQKAAAGGKTDEEGKVGLAAVRQGGC